MSPKRKSGNTFLLHHSGWTNPIETCEHHIHHFHYRFWGQKCPCLANHHLAAVSFTPWKAMPNSKPSRIFVTKKISLNLYTNHAQIRERDRKKTENMGYTLPGRLTAGSTKNQPIEIPKVVIWVSKHHLLRCNMRIFFQFQGTISQSLYLLLWCLEKLLKNHPKWWWIMVQSNKKSS